MVELVVAEGARRRRRRTAVAGGVAATLLVLAGGVRLSQLGGSEGSLDVTTDQPDQPNISSPDSGGEGTGSGDGVATSPGSTTPDPGSPNGEASAPPGATTFAALTDDQLVVLGDAATGQVTNVLVDASTDGSQLGDDVALTPDRGAVYFVATPAEGDHAGQISIFRVLTDGSDEPVWVAAGTNPAVSPDGTYLAYVGNSSEVILRDIADTHNPRTWAAPEESEDVIRDLAFTADSKELAFVAAPPDEPGVLYLLDVLGLSSLSTGASLNDAGRLGPPDEAPAGTGWSTPDYRAGHETMVVVESCCALGAEGYDGDTSFVVIDPTTGQSPGDTPVSGGSGTVVMAKYDISGQNQLVLTADAEGQTSLYRGEAGQLQPLDQAPHYRAVDW
jgi:hypothetical protein